MDDLIATPLAEVRSVIGSAIQSLLRFCGLVLLRSHGIGAFLMPRSPDPVHDNAGLLIYEAREELLRISK